MIDGQAIKPTRMFRIPYDRAEGMAVSRHAREMCGLFRFPYQAIVLPLYGSEVARLRKGAMPIGCVNQPWAGPLLVWYPEGNWTEVCG